MLSHEDALRLIEKYLKDDKLIKHCYAVEVIMKDLARKLGKDEELWGITGLLHDLDYEYTKDHPEKHANLTAQILDGLVPDSCVNAIKGHNYMHTDYIPTTSIDKALIAADAVSGLIIAAALVMPSKKLSEVRLETLINKFKDASFAKGCNRKRIELCIDAGVALEPFLKLSLTALQNISDNLDL